MENKKPFSLIAPASALAETDSHWSGRDTIKQLGAEWLLWNRKTEWSEHITHDAETIRYRSAAFADLAAIPELADICQRGAELLENIDELRKIRESSGTNEAMLYSIKEVETYIDFIAYLSEALATVRHRIHSDAFLGFCDLIDGTAKSADFIALREGVSSLSHSVANIRSLTVGINLDGNISPYESGIISVNEEYFRSGDIISRFMRLDGGNKDMVTLAPLAVSGKQFNASESASMNAAISGALKKIVGSGLRGWQAMLKKYFAINTDIYVKLLPELYFLCGGAKIIYELKKNKLPLCIPTVCPMAEKRFSVTGLYNPASALHLREQNPDAIIVPNDFSFDRDGMIYILTGPNRGGKSFFLCSVGIAQIMFQLGLPVAAQSASISPVDIVCTHFSTEVSSTLGKGRLGEECARLQEIFRTITEYSLVLMDETLSSTDSYEATAIAQELLTGMSAYGCRGIFATHLHDLAQRTDAVNSLPTSNSKLDNLVAEMSLGERSYRITRKTPDGRSFARDIAVKYGLSLDKILDLKKEGSSQ